jgi:hypothetical protein
MKDLAAVKDGLGMKVRGLRDCAPFFCGFALWGKLWYTERYTEVFMAMTAQTQKGLTFEKVWTMFQETDKKFQETDRLIKETRESQKETSEQVSLLESPENFVALQG